VSEEIRSLLHPRKKNRQTASLRIVSRLKNIMHDDTQSIVRQAQSQLNASGYYELKGISCDYEEESGVLTLQGCVSSFYIKQLAQSLVGKLTRVQQVDNLLDVTEKGVAPTDADE